MCWLWQAMSNVHVLQWEKVFTQTFKRLWIFTSSVVHFVHQSLSFQRLASVLRFVYTCSLSMIGCHTQVRNEQSTVDHACWCENVRSCKLAVKVNCDVMTSHVRVIRISLISSQNHFRYMHMYVNNVKIWCLEEVFSVVSLFHLRNCCEPPYFVTFSNHKRQDCNVCMYILSLSLKRHWDCMALQLIVPGNYTHAGCRKASLRRVRDIHACVV